MWVVDTTVPAALRSFTRHLAPALCRVGPDGQRCGVDDLRILSRLQATDPRVAFAYILEQTVWRFVESGCLAHAGTNVSPAAKRLSAGHLRERAARPVESPAIAAARVASRVRKESLLKKVADSVQIYDQRRNIRPGVCAG